MTCPKCPDPLWCQTHDACGREVRARWAIGRRAGFRDRTWLEPPQPKSNETESQFRARMRAANPVFVPWKGES